MRKSVLIGATVAALGAVLVLTTPEEPAVALRGTLGPGQWTASLAVAF